MTIEEYLRKIRELNENLSVHMDEQTQKYLATQRDLIDELLGKLSTFDHEVTLREVKEFCQTHEQCSRCSVVDMCRFDCPRIWDIEEMERRMKYEKEKRMKEAKNADKLEEST